ncbi:hypothetical protein J2786_001110 [Chryseobacterium vietnamense]|uniref:Uncharacterized protein n=1 Tax=Chryseobacterium vietnamense TaxID=866785 RepID=A0ACC6J5H8_9FLAO|nr:hypothetical protein [Chryseobacterium vietnamense]MDR6458017.1 hypothetical protein [Chryseobacterium vietnamense]
MPSNEFKLGYALSPEVSVFRIWPSMVKAFSLTITFIRPSQTFNGVIR